MDYEIIGETKVGKTWGYKIKCKICGHEKEITKYNFDKAALNHNGINCKEDYYDSFIGQQIEDYIIDSRQGDLYQMHCIKCGTKTTVKLRSLQVSQEHSHQHGLYCYKNLPPSPIKDAIAIRFNDIKQRCENPKHPSYSHYGERHICCEYQYAVDLYYDFYDELLKHSEKHGLENSSFDRIDVNGNYCKENLRITTQSIQSTNTTRKKLFILEKNGQRILCDNAMEFGRRYNCNGRSVGNVIRGSSKTADGQRLIKVFPPEMDIDQIIKEESVTTKLITT